MPFTERGSPNAQNGGARAAGLAPRAVMSHNETAPEAFASGAVKVQVKLENRHSGGCRCAEPAHGIYPSPLPTRFVFICLGIGTSLHRCMRTFDEDWKHRAGLRYSRNLKKISPTNLHESSRIRKPLVEIRADSWAVF